MLHLPIRKTISRFDRMLKPFEGTSFEPAPHLVSLKAELERIADAEARYFSQNNLEQDLNPRLQLSPAFREIERYFEVLVAA